MTERLTSMFTAIGAGIVAGAILGLVIGALGDTPDVVSGAIAAVAAVFINSHHR